MRNIRSFIIDGDRIPLEIFNRKSFFYGGLPGWSDILLLNEITLAWLVTLP